MQKTNTILQLENEFKKIKSIVSDDTRFMTIGILFIANRLDLLVSIDKKLKKLLFEIETRIGEEPQVKDLFNKYFPEYEFE